MSQAMCHLCLAGQSEAWLLVCFQDFDTRIAVKQVKFALAVHNLVAGRIHTRIGLYYFLLRRSFRISRVALAPDAPVKPAPG
jgi:hypothetical protein